MRLTQKLLGYLNRVFSRDPQQSLAIQFEYAGSGMTWNVDDGILTVTVTGGVGVGFALDLSAYTVAGLASNISGRAGFTVTFLADSDLSGLSAMVLLDGSGDQNATGGKSLYGYTNPLYAYMETAARELQDAEKAVVEALKQLQIRDAAGNASASGYWLDEIGGYYKVRRSLGEPDTVYGPRIIAEVLRPRGNNVALEMAIETFTGQEVTVTDVVIPPLSDPCYNGAHSHNGSIQHDSNENFIFCLFDVGVGYDLENGGDITAFQDSVIAVIERLRDAGTHLRALALGGSSLMEVFSPPADGDLLLIAGADLADTLTGPNEDLAMIPVTIGMMADTAAAADDDTDSLVVIYSMAYNGGHHHDSVIRYIGGYTATSGLDGSGETVA